MRHHDLQAVARSIGDHPGMSHEGVEYRLLAVLEVRIVLRLAGEIEPENAARPAGFIDEGDLGLGVGVL